jgi:hypothetical protein
MMVGRLLLSIAGNGRSTFLAAGAVLGVGLYGFVVTFKPYTTERSLEPIIIPQVEMVERVRPVEAMSAAPPEEAVVEPTPSAPGSLAVALPRPAATVAPSPSPASGGVGAAGNSGAVPLDPAPRDTPSIGPVVIDEAAVAILLDPTRGSVSDAKPDEPQPGGDGTPPPTDGKGDEGEHRAEDPQVNDPAPDKSKGKSEQAKSEKAAQENGKPDKDDNPGKGHSR